MIGIKEYRRGKSKKRLNVGEQGARAVRSLASYSRMAEMRAKEVEREQGRITKINNNIIISIKRN